jgi:hypothetical protein
LSAAPPSLGRDEQADGYAGFAKETFEAGLWGRVPAVFLGCGAGLVEVGSPGKFFHEDQVLGLTLTPTYHPGGPQRFAIFGKAGEEIVGRGGEVRVAPSPEFLRECRKVFQAQVAVEVWGSVAAKNFLLGADVMAKNRLGILQGVRRDDEAFRLRESDPKLVVFDDRVGSHVIRRLRRLGRLWLR